MKRFTLLLLLLATLANCQPPERFPEEVARNIEKRIEAGVNPSIAVGIIDKDGVHYFNYGKTTANGMPANEHTIYEIGSISKVFTAILLAQHVTDGTVQLDDPANKYLPAHAQIRTMGGSDITLATLSDHTSGLPRMPNNLAPANPKNPYADYSVDSMYKFISTTGAVREAGVQYEYSNLAQGLLGHILAEINKTTYEALMLRVIATPLKMNETKITLDERMKANLAKGHAGGYETDNWDIPTLAGAGAIRSSTADMLKFLAANMGLTETPLRKAIELTHQVRHAKAGPMRVGLGWHIKQGGEGDVIWHNGGTGGYRAFAGFVKDTGKGVVVLTNSTVSIDDIGFHLLDPDSPLNPVTSKSDAVKVPEETLQTYVGTYQLTPEFSIAITREGSQLFGQATAQPRFELYARNPTDFFLVVVDAQITFQTSDGKAESLTLFQGGQKLVGKKVD